MSNLYDAGSIKGKRLAKRYRWFKSADMKTKVRKARAAVAVAAWHVRALRKLLTFPVRAEHLLDGFRHAQPGNKAYDDLVRYMALSWITYRNKAGSGAEFFGHPSWSGPECDALEGFARMMPLFAAWVKSGRDPVIGVAGHSLDLVAEFRRGLLAGTDPSGVAYWGAMPGTSNQRIVEAADVALALWLLRDVVWDRLTDAEQRQVVDWFGLANGKPGLDNNWHLFFILIDRVLADLGFPDRLDRIQSRYERVKEFHVGEGWFSDGPDGSIDYYNAWGFHYSLAWIDIIDPDWDPDFIRQVQRAFIDGYRLLIGPRGFPMFGRSVLYRMAMPVPLVAGVRQGLISAGEARRGLDCIWSHFIRNGALKRGIISQGFYGTDSRLIDPYSGPASSLWSLRSLVVALHYPAQSEFWTADPLPLPVETGDFDVYLPGPRWHVRGIQASSEITIALPEKSEERATEFTRQGWYQNLRCFLGIASRPKNLGPKYDLPAYSSRGLF